MSAPDITIFVRHSAGCKYFGDETAKRCTCRKHLRWTEAGKQRKLKAGTRSWSEAETVKAGLLDQFAGRTTAKAAANALREGIETFLQDKRVQGVADDTVATYTRELGRLADYCEAHGFFTVQALTREVLTGYCATWAKTYASSVTRSKVRERLRGFLRYAYETEWLPRVPALPKIRVDAVPTMPLTVEQYTRLLASIDGVWPDDVDANLTKQRRRIRQRVRGLLQLMRWSGLSLRDATSLPRAEMLKGERGFYKIVTKRTKTGTDVSVAIPGDVGAELLTVPNDNPKYFFWTGESKGDNHTTKWQTRFIAPVFKAAGLYDECGHMVSHRLRDTFACDLLEKGVQMGDVSKLLGHESIKTTEKHYAKWVKGRQDRLDDIVAATWAAEKKPRKAA